LGGEDGVGLHKIWGLLVVGGIRNVADRREGVVGVKVVASAVRPLEVMVTRWLSRLNRLKEAAWHGVRPLDR